jgi:hypothetical protein
MKKPKIYFGHSINFYNTEIEADLIMQINFFFPGYDLENPNQKIHEANYQKWKSKSGNGMEYYLNKVLPKMSAGIFLPFGDGMFGKGVFSEMKKLDDLGKPIWEINFEGHIKSIDKLDFCRELSLEETRKRVYRNN